MRGLIRVHENMLAPLACKCRRNFTHSTPTHPWLSEHQAIAENLEQCACKVISWHCPNMFHIPLGEAPPSQCSCLQVYDLWPIKIGPFLESGVVPIVLAPIWLLYGYLYPLLDEVFADEEATREANERATAFSTLAWTWVLAAAQFILSDVMYLQGVTAAFAHQTV